MNGPDDVKRTAEDGATATRVFLAHMQERLTFFEGRGDAEHADAVRHIMVGVTRFLEMEEGVARREEEGAGR